MIKKVGKKQIEQASSWLASAGGFGAAGFMGLLYITDWRLFLDYLPYYNGKYEKKEEK